MTKSLNKLVKIEIEFLFPDKDISESMSMLEKVIARIENGERHMLHYSAEIQKAVKLKKLAESND